LDLDASQLNLHMVLQIMEVTTDAQMKQTMRRPLPSGCMGMSYAVAFAVTMGVSDVILLAWKVFVHILPPYFLE
jgi:heme O synthase-like polyprenyltransferase